LDVVKKDKEVVKNETTDKGSFRGGE
jgi:hypothetical protein